MFSYFPYGEKHFFAKGGQDSLPWESIDSFRRHGLHTCRSSKGIIIRLYEFPRGPRSLEQLSKLQLYIYETMHGLKLCTIVLYYQKNI